MKKYIAVIAVLIVFGVFAYAHEGEEEGIDCSNVLIQGTPVEEYEIKLPDAVASIFEGEKTNLYITLEDGHEITVGGEVEKKVLQNLTCSGFENPTMKAHISQETLEDVLASEDPEKAFLNAKNSGEIKIEAVGIVQSIKVFFVELFSGILGLFG